MSLPDKRDVNTQSFASSSGDARSPSAARDFNSQGIQLFLHYQLEALEDCQRRLQQQESLLRDYVGLRTRLSTIAEQARYPAVIPIGPHAVVRGELVHTNEILVFLGDNYFAERSSKQVSLLMWLSGRLID